MANLNKVFLIGRLTRDPELRFTPGGTAVAEFGLAVNRQWTDQSGEKKESTCFVDLQAWGRQGEVLNEYMKKGRQIFIEGRLDFSQWEDKEGQKRSRLKVVVEGFQFLDGGGGARKTEESPDAESLSGESLGAPSRPARPGRYPSSKPDSSAPSRPATAEPAASPEPPGDEYNLGDVPF